MAFCDAIYTRLPEPQQVGRYSRPLQFYKLSFFNSHLLVRIAPVRLARKFTVALTRNPPFSGKSGLLVLSQG
jgi:hypothetical protein